MWQSLVPRGRSQPTTPLQGVPKRAFTVNNPRPGEKSNVLRKKVTFQFVGVPNTVYLYMFVKYCIYLYKIDIMWSKSYIYKLLAA